MWDESLEKAPDGVGILNQEEGHQQDEDGLKDPVDQHEDVLHHGRKVAGQQGRQVSDGIGVGLPQVDRDAQHRDHVLLVGQVLEVARDRRPLGHERVNLLADDRNQVEDARGQDPRKDAVEDQDRDRPGNAAALRRIHSRIHDQGQDGGEEEGAEDAPDRDRQDQRQHRQNAQEDQGAEVTASP